MKKTVGRIALHKQTVRNLVVDQLDLVQGGRINQSGPCRSDGGCTTTPSFPCTQGLVCATGPHNNFTV